MRTLRVLLAILALLISHFNARSAVVVKLPEQGVRYFEVANLSLPLTANQLSDQQAAEIVSLLRGFYESTFNRGYNPLASPAYGGRRFYNLSDADVGIVREIWVEFPKHYKGPLLGDALHFILRTHFNVVLARGPESVFEEYGNLQIRPPVPVAWFVAYPRNGREDLERRYGRFRRTYVEGILTFNESPYVPYDSAFRRVAPEPDFAAYNVDEINRWKNLLGVESARSVADGCTGLLPYIRTLVPPSDKIFTSGDWDKTLNKLVSRIWMDPKFRDFDTNKDIVVKTASLVNRCLSTETGKESLKAFCKAQGFELKILPPDSKQIRLRVNDF